MKQGVTMFLLLFLTAHITVADPAVTSQADRLYLQRENRRAIDILKAALAAESSPVERAEMYWRLARHTLDLGDMLFTEGADKDTLRTLYEQALAYADETIQLAPHRHEGYYWKAAGIGRSAQVKGIISALFDAKPMRDLLYQALRIYPDHGESWYVLGMMYELLPPFPLSFGNHAYAVSLGRRSIEANRTELKTGAVEIVRYSYYIQLARHLWARDWNREKRIREHGKQGKNYKNTDDSVERYFYYEGTIPLEPMSDREEAKNILHWVIDEIESIDSPIPPYESDLLYAQETLDSWE